MSVEKPDNMVCEGDVCRPFNGGEILLADLKPTDNKPVVATAEPLSYEATKAAGFEALRPALIEGIKQERGDGKAEELFGNGQAVRDAQGKLQIGNGQMLAIRDGQGNLRDFTYGPSSDVKSRTFHYSEKPNANGEYEVEAMVMNSKKHGFQVWEKVPGTQNLWEEQIAKNKPGAKPTDPIQATMRVDQKTGEFHFQQRGFEPFVYAPNGERTQGAKPTASDKLPPQTKTEPVRETEEQQAEVPLTPEKAVEYEAKTEQVYGKAPIITNKDNYRENLFSSAENRKPIVMTFGHGSAPGMDATLDAVGRSKAVASGSADFMYVDLDKVDPKSPIGEYARYIKKDFTTPFTIVFNQKQGDTPGYPVQPEVPMHYQKGAFKEDALNAAVAEAAAIQATREIKTGREKVEVKDGSDKPPAVPTAVIAPTAEALLDECLKPFKDQRSEQMMKGLTPKEKERAYWKGIDEADKRAKDFAERKDFNPNNAAEVAQLQRLNNVKAQMRAMVGFASIGWGKESELHGPQYKEETDKHYMRGAEYLMSAGSMNKDLYQYPEFTQAVRDSALPGNAGNSLIERGQANPNWYHETKEDWDYAKTVAPGFKAAEIKAAQDQGDAAKATLLAAKDYEMEIAGQRARERFQKTLREEMLKPRPGGNPYDHNGRPRTPVADPNNPYDYNGRPRTKAS